MSVTDVPDHGNAGEVEITLSRRNILALLHKLDWDDSERTIQKFADGIILTVVAEDDNGHYGDGVAGVMHAETERFIEECTTTKTYNLPASAT